MITWALWAYSIKNHFTQDFEIEFRLGRVNIIKILFVLLLCYIATYFSQQWQEEMDDTIGLYQEVIIKEREDRASGLWPIIGAIRSYCKKSQSLEERYLPIIKHIEKDLSRDNDEIYIIPLDKHIEQFESRFGKSRSNSSSYDIIDYYQSIFDTIIDELDNPFNQPSKDNRAIIIRKLKPLPNNSVKIDLIPIAFHLGPTKEIDFQGHKITVKSSLDEPLEVTNIVTGKKQKLKFDKYFN